MGNGAVAAIAGILTAIVGVAALAVLVSKNSNTSGVISAGAGGLSQFLGVAVSPVTGTSVSSGNASLP